MGRRAHQPDPAQRRQVEAMAAYGVPETDIATVIGVDPKTLRKHYRAELDTGEIKANSKVAESLYRKALGDGAQSVTAAIFWLKTRARWREAPQEHEVVHTDYSQLTDAELEAIIADKTAALGYRLVPDAGRKAHPVIEHARLPRSGAFRPGPAGS